MTKPGQFINMSMYQMVIYLFSHTNILIKILPLSPTNPRCVTISRPTTSGCLIVMLNNF